MFRIKFFIPKLTLKIQELVLREEKHGFTLDYQWLKQQGSDGLSGYLDRSFSDWSNSSFSFEGIVAVSFPRRGELGR